MVLLILSKVLIFEVVKDVCRVVLMAFLGKSVFKELLDFGVAAVASSWYKP